MGLHMREPDALVCWGVGLTWRPGQWRLVPRVARPQVQGTGWRGIVVVRWLCFSVTRAWRYM